MIFSSWPSFTQEEADAVCRVLLSGKVNYWTGEEGRLFEKEFAQTCDISHAVALSNGTVALELALTCLGIGNGDEVIVTPRTFIASVSAIVNVGATPIFADIDRDSQNITAETISTVLTDRTAAIVAVHLAGWPCDMDAIMALSDEHGLKLVEDCAQAHGAVFKGRSVGSFGHAAAWSFCQDKIMTTGGEGGMLTTGNADLWQRAWSYKDHGKSWGASLRSKDSSRFRWLHDSFGTNWRMTEMQAAIGRIQIGYLAEWHEKRKRNAETILGVCDEYPSALREPYPSAEIEHAWYKCYVFVRQNGLKDEWDRDRIMSEIKAQGVPCFSGSCPEVYLEKAFEGTGFRPEQRLPVAMELGETSLMFMVHPTLSEEAINLTCSVIREVMELASA